MEHYQNAQGYGIFCGKKCVAEKQAQGIAPKRGKKNISEWNAQQAQAAQAQQAMSEKSGGKSKAPLIIGVVLGVAVIATVIIIAKRKK